MKLVDVIVLSVILVFFSTVFAEEISGLRKMDLMIEQLQTEADSLIFISESSVMPSEVPEGLPYVLISYGADKKEGGKGDACDIYSWK